MKVLKCYSENDFRIEEMKKPSINSDEVLIEMIYCSLCVSDIIKIFDKNQKKPDVYGHEVVGRVIEAGKNISKLKIGEIVAAAHHVPCGKCHFCLHGNHSMCEQFKETNFIPGGFAQYIKLSDKHIKNTTFKIPECFDLLKTLFMEPLACCIRAMNRIEIMNSDVFTVIGAGTIGIQFLQLIKLKDIKTIVIDTCSKRLKTAIDLGADYILNPLDGPIPNRVKKIIPRGIDNAILTITNKRIINDAMSYIRPGGTITVFGVSDKDYVLPLDFKRLYSNEIILKSTYSATPETLSSAFDLILQGKLEFAPLISKVIPLSQFKVGLDRMLNKEIYKAFFTL